MYWERKNSPPRQGTPEHHIGLTRTCGHIPDGLCYHDWYTRHGGMVSSPVRLRHWEARGGLAVSGGIASSVYPSSFIVESLCDFPAKLVVGLLSGQALIVLSVLDMNFTWEVHIVVREYDSYLLLYRLLEPSIMVIILVLMSLPMLTHWKSSPHLSQSFCQPIGLRVNTVGSLHYKSSQADVLPWFGRAERQNYHPSTLGSQTDCNTEAWQSLRTPIATESGSAPRNTDSTKASSEYSWVMGHSTVDHGLDFLCPAKDRRYVFLTMMLPLLERYDASDWVQSGEVQLPSPTGSDDPA
ncbi:hypothetical protein BO78DRAFT_386544 [Aspergillus sclerotiicarbonarius CBS 121057]|uniref:Uncharacterized protein n=1 Tax=Aspergillus sclerotiicarbonarius (strain CBS 121057 / IBT 28362) TaxID=1448318 RepID=A0A319E9S1_ASPSB|nr:hypothetical protein BO78DRAFT_386544 [Aspergillus sclerotiicarbonarius CBS 121057]